MASDKFEKGATLSHQFVTPAKDVLTKLSFAHIRDGGDEGYLMSHKACEKNSWGFLIDETK